MQSTVCAICGKSAYETVAPPPPPPARRWTDAFEHNELRKTGVTLLALLVIVAGVAYVLTRPDNAPDANPLPPPASTTTVETIPPSSDAPPSLLGGARPASGFIPGTPREVGEGLSPWETPPPIDFVTGLLLDKSLDYSVDIARIGDLLDIFPDVATLTELDPPEIQTFRGIIDAELLEATQPFAARTLSGSDDAAIGQIWLIASGGSEAGDDYLTAARERWNPDGAIDQFSPDVGVRLWLLAGDATTKVWLSDLEDDSMVLVRVAADVDPQFLTDTLRSWRRAVD